MVAIGAIEILMLLMFSGGMGLPSSIPPLPEDPLLARVAPAECLAYIQWSGSGELNATGKNGTERLLAEPKVKAFLQAVEAQMSQAMQGPGAGGYDPMAAVKLLTQRPACFFLSKLKLGPNGPTDIEGGFVIHLGDHAKEIEAALEKLQDGNGAETVQINGRPFRRVKPNPSLPPVTWGIRNKYLIGGMGHDIVEGIEQRVKGSAPEWLNSTKERLSVARVSGISYVNLAKLIPIVLAGAPDGANVKPILTLLGIDGISTIASVSGLDETGFVTRSEVAITGVPSGIMGWIDGTTITATDLQNIPAQSPVALSFKFDAGKLYDWGMGLWGRFAPGEKQQYDQTVAAIEAQNQFNLRKDLIGSLGESWRIVADGGPTPLMNGWTIVIPVKDRARFGVVYDRAMTLMQMQLGQGRGPQLQQITIDKYKGFSVALPLPIPGVALNPTWCLTDKELIISASTAPVQAIAARRSASPSLAQQPEIAAMMKSGSGALMITSIDMKAVVEFALPLMDAALKQAGAFAGPGGPGAIANIQLPPMDVLTKHLEPSRMSIVRTQAGIEFYSKQTFPGSNIGASAPTMIAMTLPAVGAARGAARRAQSSNNLKQILLALHNFHDVNTKLPAAHTLDKDGKPALSWRVMILPYIEQEQLFRQFHLNEPWDSDHNKQLIEKMPVTFRSPESKTEPGKTNYLGLAGEKGIFVKAEGAARNGLAMGIGFAAVTDGTSNTAAVVEVDDDRATIWTKPDDFEPDVDDVLKFLGNLQAGGFNMGMMDGSVRFIGNTIDRNVLKAIFTRNGGEAVQLP